MSKGFLAMLDAVMDVSTSDGEAQAMMTQDLVDQESQKFIDDERAAIMAESSPEEEPLAVQITAVANHAYQAVQEQNAAQARVVEASEYTFMMPPSREYRKGGNRWQLMFEGVCSHCAHCGQPLTDAVSVERGIGPICSKKGYSEEPVQGDEMEAVLALAEFPDLMELVTHKYKPQGARAIMNFLVKICSLNRRSPVHQSCTDAIEALGFRTLASTLRESLATVEVKESKTVEGSMEVWVKKTDFNWAFYNALRRFEGSYFSKAHRANLVPVWHWRSQEECVGLPPQAFVDPCDGERQYPAKVWKLTPGDPGQRKPVRVALWDLVTAHFAGLYVKTPKGCVKIKARAK